MIFSCSIADNYHANIIKIIIYALLHCFFVEQNGKYCFCSIHKDLAHLLDENLRLEKELLKIDPLRYIAFLLIKYVRKDINC
jgi:hypothetical protein